MNMFYYNIPFVFAGFNRLDYSPESISFEQNINRKKNNLTTSLK